MENNNWNILFIDDDEDDYVILKSLLHQAKGRKFTLKWASSYEAGKSYLYSNHYDAVLVDYDLGAHTGFEIIREAVDCGYPAPLILYTGRGSEQTDLEAMQAGAALYLAKGETNAWLLERGIRYAIERKQVEQALLESNERYRRAQEELEHRVQERTQELRRANEILEKIFSNIHLMVAFLDTGFNFIRVNEKYAQADGRPLDFFPGKNHFDLYPNPENEAIFRRVVETGEPYITFARPFEYAEHPERGVTYWDWSLQPVKDEHGRVTELVFTLLDVTQYKQAEKKKSKAKK